MPATGKQPKFDSSKADAFGEKLLTALNQGSFCLMASIGHRTGLFDAMRRLAPSTSEEIAHQAGLNERYVREWLGAMAAAHYVEYDAKAETYLFTPEYAAALADEGGVVVEGRLRQLGTPAELVARPQDAFVASFTGANLLRGRALRGISNS